MRRVYGPISSLISAAVLTHSAQAAPIARASLVASPPLQEILGPDPVDGPIDAIFGFTSDSVSDLARYPKKFFGNPQILVEGFGRNDRSVCVSLRRAQGGYRAKFRTAVPSGSGRLEIPFDSSVEARARLSATEPRSIELAIQARANCSPSGPLLSTSWSGKPGQGRYILLVGGAAYGSPALRVDGGPVVECRTLSSALGRKDLGATVYSFACPFEIDRASCRPDHGVKVLWFDGAAINKQASIQVRHACG